VGRSGALGRVAQALARSRLVTVVGPPGMGKTRIAVETLRCDGRGFFCDLSAAADLPSACEAVASTLGGALGLDPTASVGRIFESVGDRLVVLDDFERLASAAGDAVRTWLAAAPEVRLLVTSRERLRLASEVVVDLEPLAPDEALALLLDRAQNGGYQSTGDDRPELERLVAALEGIPLAIELAATRLPLLGARDLAERMARPLEVLGRGYRGERAATLRGAIDGSWQLLDDAQRRALAAVSVFRGSFTVAAAEAVVGSLELIHDLRERSLLTQLEGRLSLFASIRAFAAERLDELGLREDVELRHADHFLALGRRERSAYEAQGGDLSALADARDNLLGALEAALRRGDRARATEAVLALGPVLASRGPASLHLALIESVLEEAGMQPALLHARAGALRALGEVDRAEADLRRVLEIADDPTLLVAARKDLGVVHHHRREIDEARACYEAALPAARSASLRRTEAILVGNLAALDHDVGRFEIAAREYARALDLFIAVGDLRGEGNFLTNLALLEAEEGRRREARHHLERGLALLRQAGDRRLEAIALGNLGALEHEEGDLEAAEAHHRDALAKLRAVGDVSSEALCRARLAAVLAQRGHLDDAEREMEHAERTIVGRDALTTDLVRLHRCFLELAAGDEAAAFARLEAAQQARDEGAPSLVEIHDDARLVLRMLAASMSKVGGPSLEIGPEAQWFRPPGGKRQSLDKHAAARRILDRLASERLDDPGGGLSADELFAIGWPGVSIAPESANNRLYVALAKLRKLGLKGLLLRREEGYLLDPATPLLRH
jgi:predicted ATPase